MKKLMINPIFSDDFGFSLVENLIALALVTVFLIPFGFFMVKLVHNSKAEELSTAIHLCQITMEYTIANEDYLPEQSQQIVGKRKWLINRKVVIENHLVHITVYSKPLYKEYWEHKLYLCRYQK